MYFILLIANRSTNYIMPNPNWKKGCESPNPNGSKKIIPGVQEHFIEFARKTAVPELERIAQDTSSPIELRVKIYIYLTDRAYGKAPETVKIGGNEDLIALLQAARARLPK